MEPQNNENMTKTDIKCGFDNTPMIKTALKYKWQILISTAVAAILGAVFSSSLFITPLYRSEAVAYPSNISTFSDEDESEQMLQIMGSQFIKDSIIEKYDLWKHYKIARDYKYAKSTMMYEYGQKIKITKTPYDAVSIQVMDKSPDTAAMIANDILVLYDNYSNLIHVDKYVEVSSMLHQQMLRKQHDIDSMKNRLAELAQNYGLLDYKAQSREVSRGYLSGTSKVSELKKNIELYGAEVLDLEEKISFEAEQYSELKKDYETEFRYTVSKRTYYTLVTEAYPSDHKAYPIRWVIVLACAFGAFLLSVLVAFVIERRKRND